MSRVCVHSRRGKDRRYGNRQECCCLLDVAWLHLWSPQTVSNACQVAFSLRWMQKGSGGEDFLQIPSKHQAAWRCSHQLKIQMWQIHLQMCALNGFRFVVFPRGYGNARSKVGLLVLEQRRWEKEIPHQSEVLRSVRETQSWTGDKEEDLRRAYQCCRSLNNITG